MIRYVTEFIGTFFLVLTIGLTVTQKVPMAPLAIGCSLMIMVYMGGHISGGHYNPAVSLAALLRGALSPLDFIPYLAAQLIGAIAACGVVTIVLDASFAPAPGKGVTALNAFWIEAIYTFALALVVMNVAVSKKTQGNSFYGLAIGFTVVVAAFAGGAISGGAFNPAVGSGPILYRYFLGGDLSEHLWIYLAGPFAGGFVAAIVAWAQEKSQSA